MGFKLEASGNTEAATSKEMCSTKRKGDLFVTHVNV